MWNYNKFYRLLMGYDIKDSEEHILFENKPFRLAFKTTQTEYANKFWREDGLTGDNLCVTMPRGKISYGNYSLLFEYISKGLYDVFYSPVITWKNKFAKGFIFNANMNSADIIGMDFTKKYKVDSVVCLIVSIPVTLSKDKIETGDIEAITV